MRNHATHQVLDWFNRGIAATGIRILARVDYGLRHNLLIIAISIAAGRIPLVAPTFFPQVPQWLAPLVNSGITLAAISAVLLNALFNGGGSDAEAGPEAKPAEHEGRIASV